MSFIGLSVCLIASRRFSGLRNDLMFYTEYTPLKKTTINMQYDTPASQPFTHI